MDKTSLVDGDIMEGRRFVAALEGVGLSIALGMWFRKASSEHWLLGIASPNVQVDGPLSVMRRAEQVRRAEFEPLLSVGDCTYFNTSNQFLSEIPHLSASIKDTTMTIDNFSLNGVEIDKALIFYLDRKVWSSTKAAKRAVLEKGDA